VIGVSDVIAIACGAYSSFAVRSDGKLFSCGQNISGTCGDGTSENRSTFVEALGISGVVGVAAGTFHAVAALSDGTLALSGDNSRGQLGANSTVNRSSFVAMTDI
jgi:alpha-tubulin suppressor-like RCC1 family protein